MDSLKKFEEICEEDNTYICDNCGHTFKAKEVALEDMPANVGMRPFILIDKNGIIKDGSTKAEEGDHVLACPKCKTIHPYGFSSVGGGEVI